MADPSTFTESQDAADTSGVDRTATYRTIAWRVMPLLVVCYVVSFIDRTNIGIAQQGLERDLGFGPAVYGLGVTLFFAGFIVFEVPSSALLARLGARKALVRIMASWGVVTICTKVSAPVALTPSPTPWGSGPLGSSPTRASATS